MRFINLGEWRDMETRKLITAGASVKCLHCDGEKEHEGRCDCCDHRCSHVCNECDDDGTVLFSKLSHWDRDRVLTHEKYAEAILADANLLAQWLGRNLSEVLVESGFTPWQSVIYQLTSGVVTGFRGGDLRLSH